MSKAAIPITTFQPLLSYSLPHFCCPMLLQVLGWPLKASLNIFVNKILINSIRENINKNLINSIRENIAKILSSSIGETI